MLSILIPVYNYNIVSLVKSLHKQAVEQMIDFEIIVAEDGSDRDVDENSEIAVLEFCKHFVFEQNIGRSSIRNKLSELAQYGHLLFMDCDAVVESSHFIEKYLSFCHEECVVIGGTSYDETIVEPCFSLRLTYGRKREARPATERSKNSFSTFNFLISKTLFNKVRFDESLRGYGHEDMLFGHCLRELGVDFVHIDNPLIHCGLDKNDVFLQKTKEGVRSLFQLYLSGNYPYLTTESKLLRTFVDLQNRGLSPYLGKLFPLFESRLKKMLFVRKPLLIFYDLYKLLYMCSLKKTHK